MSSVVQLRPERHRLSVEDVRAMVVGGRLDKNDRLELFDGELFEMPPESPLNLDYSVKLGRWFYDCMGATYAIVPGLALILSEFTYVKPDWWVFPSSMSTSEVRASDVLIAIEQSHTTLKFDLGYKAGLYAKHGVPEYWVVDLERRCIHVHRDPGPLGYADVPEPYGANDRAQALLIPELNLRLADLGL